MLASDLVTLVFFSLCRWPSPAIFLGLHFAVSLIQAYVFMLLAMIYLSQAVRTSTRSLADLARCAGVLWYPTLGAKTKARRGWGTHVGTTSSVRNLEFGFQSFVQNEKKIPPESASASGKRMAASVRGPAR
jgi:hypothetical protein